MSKLAANPAALSNLFLYMVERTNENGSTRNDCARLRSPYGGLGDSTVAALATDFFHQNADENFVPACVCRFVSRLCFGHGFGAFHAPCGNLLFCFGYAALRVTASRKIFFVKNTQNIFLNPP